MSDTPDLGTIRAFIAVAEAGSFATAARAAGLTRSALGKAVTRLEGRLGTRLLHRTTRRVSLTVDGAEYLARTRQILSDLAEAEASVRQDRPVARGVLRLTLPDAYGRLRVLPILKDFLREWPQLSATVNFTDRPINLVEEGVDLAVRIGSTDTSAELVGRVVARRQSFSVPLPRIWPSGAGRRLWRNSPTTTASISAVAAKQCVGPLRRRRRLWFRSWGRAA